MTDLKSYIAIFTGDGRMDSPGHSAQYCTYSLMENDTKAILAISTVDKRETGRKSHAMEPEGFRRALNFLLDNCNIAEIATDAHVSIGALLKKSKFYYT